MTSPYKPHTNDQNDAGNVDLFALLEALYERKWMVIFTTAFFSIAATIYAFSITPIYKAEVLIGFAHSTDSKSSLSALASQYGGIAGLAGLGAPSGSERSEAVATLSSRKLTERYVIEHDLLPILFEDRWNPDTKKFASDAHGKIPTPWDGNKVFQTSIRTVAEEKKTGLIRMSISWKDPVLAAQWANDFVALTNKTLRDRAIQESNSNLIYLNEQLGKTVVVELRQAIYRLIETEVKNVMVATGSTEFAFKVIDPAVPPEEKDKPKRRNIMLAGMALGLVISAALVLLLRKLSLVANAAPKD